MGSPTSPKTARHHVSPSTQHGFAYAAGYTLTPALPSTGIGCPPASPHRLATTRRGPPPAPARPKTPQGVVGLAQRGSPWALLRGYGNINPLSIDYAFRPRLRSRLTQGGLAWPWNPWSSGGGVSHPSFATHACILTPTPSTARFRGDFTGCGTLPYPPAHLRPHPRKGMSEAHAQVPQLRRCA